MHSLNDSHLLNVRRYLIDWNALFWIYRSRFLRKIVENFFIRCTSAETLWWMNRLRSLTSVDRTVPGSSASYLQQISATGIFHQPTVYTTEGIHHLPITVLWSGHSSFRRKGTVFPYQMDQAGTDAWWWQRNHPLHIEGPYSRTLYRSSWSLYTP